MVLDFPFLVPFHGVEKFLDASLWADCFLFPAISLLLALSRAFAALAFGFMTAHVHFEGSQVREAGATTTAKELPSLLSFVILLVSKIGLFIV